jgi:Zn-dependent protease with chaperone function
VVAVLAGYAILAAPLVALAPADQRALAAGLAVLTPALLFALGRLLGPRLVLRRLRQPDVEQVSAAALVTALAGSGVRDLSVACLAGGRLAPRSAGRAYRWGTTGIIMLRPVLKQAHPDLTRFIVAHEAAHLSRGDTITGVLTVAGLVGVIDTALVTNPTAIWLAALGLLGVVTHNWLRELDCDRIAARATGPAAAEQFIAYLTRAGGRRIRARLTHPPTSLRRRTIAGTLAR